jgi:hypothetical protein
LIHSLKAATYTLRQVLPPVRRRSKQARLTDDLFNLPVSGFFGPRVDARFWILVRQGLDLGLESLVELARILKTSLLGHRRSRHLRV